MLKGSVVVGWGLGSLGLADLQNFNFNANTEMFRTGGGSGSNNGQRWNSNGAVTGYGFRSGSGQQFITFDGASFNQLVNAQSPLALSRIDPVPGGFSAMQAEVPNPMSLALMGIGLLGFATARRQRR